MIAKLIRWSVANRFLVLLATAMLTAWGVWGVRSTPVDALPDLSDVQVIIRTNYPGQAPQIVENQVTYPLATTMLSVPGAKTVRGFSFFGDSFVYVLFEDGTDLYWARSRAAAASWQMAAQSMSRAMHFAIIFTSSSAKQAAAQWLHAIAHALHASMHWAYFSWDIRTLLTLKPAGRRKGTAGRPR